MCLAKSANDLINFDLRLAAILNFVIFTELNKCKMTGPWI